ncbi:hypothetical protein FRC20_002634 [Serendipita sp. 405]|nr:hypothetical protein FRC20_002634 [Serendipita sp. 405]
MADKHALWEQGRDESVEVNQRALIDKVLARYSGEFTVFRELLQNADDAAATAVQIIFETKDYLERHKSTNSNEIKEGASVSNGISTISGGEVADTDRPLPNLKDIILAQWTFKNNGTIFREEDWNRLKKIGQSQGHSQFSVVDKYRLLICCYSRRKS